MISIICFLVSVCTVGVRPYNIHFILVPFVFIFSYEMNDSLCSCDTYHDHDARAHQCYANVLMVIVMHDLSSCEKS